MIYIAYIAVASLVVWFSILASKYIDLIDKKSKLSGAFLGGVLLSAVTSLPELFTSISAAVFLDKPSLCIGNILGSDIFNIAALSGVALFFVGSFSRARLSRGHSRITAMVMMIYALIILNMLHVLDFDILSLSITSILILVLYLLGIRYLSSGDGGEAEQQEEADDSPLTMRGIVIRFVLASLGIIGLSIVLTYITDELSVRLNLGAGLAGALFLGVATSLPELSSTVALFRMGNHNIAAGNIAGSNIFNFFIICLVDMTTRSTVWEFSDPNVVNLLTFGLSGMALFYVMLRWRRKAVTAVCALLIIGAYLVSLVLG